jgi:hypothetical protein
MSTNPGSISSADAILRSADLLPRMRTGWRAYEVYLSALIIFAASRAVVVAGVNLGKLTLRAADIVRTLDPATLQADNVWYYRLLHWDSGCYHAIVRDGYQFAGDPSVTSSVAFFPLYPLFTYAVKSLLRIDTDLALLIVANVAALAAALLFTKFVKDELGDRIALLSLGSLCFFPSSLFLSAGYSESLCLAFVLLSFILLRREKFVLAAVVAGLAAGTRSTGIVMLPVILWEVWWRNKLPWPRLLPRMVLCGLLAASGLLAYMAFLGIKFGQPLAFATSQFAWNPGTWRGDTIFERFLSSITLAPFWHAYPEWIAVFVSFLALSLWSFRRLRLTLSLYAVGSLMLPYLMLGITSSMIRFGLICFPAWMCVGILCERRLWLTISLIGILGAILLWESALFSQWYFVG